MEVTNFPQSKRNPSKSKAGTWGRNLKLRLLSECPDSGCESDCHAVKCLGSSSKELCSHHTHTHTHTHTPVWGREVSRGHCARKEGVVISESDAEELGLEKWEGLSVLPFDLKARQLPWPCVLKGFSLGRGI